MTDRNLSPAKKGFDKTSWHMLRPLFFIFFAQFLTACCIDKDDVSYSPPPVSVKCMMMGRNDKTSKVLNRAEKRGAPTSKPRGNCDPIPIIPIWKILEEISVNIHANIKLLTYDLPFK